jgi:hypothetical protein
LIFLSICYIRWTAVQQLSKTQFKRITGVYLVVFHIMVKALEEANVKSRKDPSILNASI